MVSPFFKQCFVASACLLAAMSVGGAVSYPTVLMHQLKTNDSTIPLDFDTASWIGAIHGLAGIPSIFMPTLMQWRGRKTAFIAACLILLTGWILSYLAGSATFLLISESFQGLGCNSIYAVTCLSITEMTASDYRDNFIKIYYVLVTSSMAVDGLLTQYLHWKTISLIMVVPIILGLVIAFWWPESPYWLAYKQRFSECEKSFIWLRGSDAKAKKELLELINSQKCRTKSVRSFKFQFFLEKITSRDFYVPLAHIFVLEYLVHGIGSLTILIYAIELFGKATSNTEVALYGSFIVTTVQLSGILVSVVMNKYLKNKTLLLGSVLAAILSLLTAACVSYLQEAGTLSKDSLLCVFCLVVYMASISLGIMPVAYPIASALLPVKHRGLGGIIYVTNTCLLHSLALKLAPYLFLYAHLYGTFMIFAFNGLLCGLLIWKFVPETRGRSLQEIEDFYRDGEFKVVGKVSNLKALIEKECTED